ncbi:MAG: protein kinase [Myxococcales bacterium]|nr:protein kinase [Myxococcales bacterium]
MPEPLQLGRYVLYHEIAHGGMATIYLGRQQGAVGFSRTVAIKRLHPHYARDPSFVSMFLDEARLAARIQHPNVVATHDVVTTKGELFLVMEHVTGVSLSVLLRLTDQPPDLAVASAIVTDGLHGLHAAHEARNESGLPLEIVHRDISPQNILVGVDGAARLLDFGVAKAANRFHSTGDGAVKGKLPYMAPEQLRGQRVDRRTDVYAMSVVLWETLTRTRLFEGNNEGAIVEQVLFRDIQPPSSLAPAVPPALDALVMRGLARDPKARFQSAREMALALEACVRPALRSEVATWVAAVAAADIERRTREVAEVESAAETRTSLEDVLEELEAPSSTRPVVGAPSPRRFSVDAETAPALAPAPTSAPALVQAPPDARSPARPLRYLGPGVAAVLLLGLLFGAWRIARTARASEEATTGRASASATTLEPAPPTASAAPAASSAAPPAASSAIGAAPSTAAPPSPTSSNTAPRPKPTLAAPSPSAPKVDCSTKYVVTPEGKRIYKRECL